MQVIISCFLSWALLLTPLAVKSESSNNNQMKDPPSWQELDDRPLVRWYRDAKFGIFLHWGVFSVPAFGSEWFQIYWQGNNRDANQKYRDFVQATERPHFAYSEYASRFRAELYQPTEWAQAFAQAGAQYVVLTSKHHEGYCMWDSRDIPSTWQWNVMDVGPRRDLLGELASAIKNTTSPLTQQKIQFGVYHSLYEWFNPMYVQDKAKIFTTSTFVDTKTMPELYDLVKKYQPTLIWSDGEWEAPSDYWKAREFIDWYSTTSPVAARAVWNDRWGSDTTCKHGGYLTCTDRYHPNHAMTRYWEKCLSLDRTSWGYNRNASLDDYLTTADLIHELIVTVAQNGNLLLNVGPASDGRIPTIFLDRLRAIGAWLKVNGPGIYGTSTWSVCTNEGNTVYYTRKGSTLYVHVLKWPENNRVFLRCIQSAPKFIHMLGVAETLDWGYGADFYVDLPVLTPDRVPRQFAAWVLALQFDAQELQKEEGRIETAAAGSLDRPK